VIRINKWRKADKCRWRNTRWFGDKQERSSRTYLVTLYCASDRDKPTLILSLSNTKLKNLSWHDLVI